MPPAKLQLLRNKTKTENAIPTYKVICMQEIMYEMNGMLEKYDGLKIN